MSIDLFHLIHMALDDPSLKPLPKSPGKIEPIINFLFALAGALAFLFVVIGGLRYILSRGNPDGVAKAKDTIIYALVGLLVVVTAFGIVTFVLNNI